MSERSKFGVIATFVSPQGKTVTREFFGAVLEATAQVAEWCDAHPGWLVRCLSTPMTIQADLKGRAPNRSVEVAMLTRVGRVELAEAMS